MCRVREWDLSYKCLTSYAARARLRSMKDDDPDFWFKLTKKHSQDLAPKESEPQIEDTEETNFDGEDDCELDDSDVPLKTVIDSIVMGRQPNTLRVRKNGTFKSNQDIEPVDEVVSSNVGEKTEDFGRGKWVKKANRLYTGFWRHNDNDGSDNEDEI